MESVSQSQGSAPASQTAIRAKPRLTVRPWEAVFFVIGLVVLLVASVLVHAHPRPYSLDLWATLAIQGFPSIPVLTPVIEFVSALNDPTPSIIALALWLVGLVVIGLVARARGRSPVRWFQSAASIILTVAIAGGLNLLINTLVGRPRPGSFGEHIRIFGHIPEHSFPSGHTEHDVAYYGFLLYLSLTPPVRQWRYSRWLIPLQIIAAFDILTIGYSRILEGEHWLTDVLGGYLSGALWLLMCIVIYRFVTDVIAQRLQAQGVPSGETVSTETESL
ncbi:MAG TPA: phosphatase PAP2 family protein [Ktedonobacteraceae bacterium]|nr:phosphatase PAP2 family protein [Ktedonobacteraceae bacterium]